MFKVVKENLESLGYKVSVFRTAKEASDYINQAIDQKTVGFGGSMTLKEMGIYETLSAHNTVFWHAVKREDIKPASTAQVYLPSVNGLAETGEIINIDGNCNRVASLLYGHEDVYLVIGKNKLAKDYDSALARARNIAAPMNAKRLGKNTPCATGGRCFNCKSPDRICRALSVLWTKPTSARYEIILIEENLGY